MVEKNSLTPLEKELIEILEKIWFEKDLKKNMEKYLSYLIFSEGIDPNCIFRGGKNFLTNLFSRGRSAIICEFLKKYGLNLNSIDNEGISLLEISVCQRDFRFFKALLSLKADPNIITSEKKSLLILTVECASTTKNFYGIEFVEELIEAGVNWKKDFPELSGTGKSSKELARLFCTALVR